MARKFPWSWLSMVVVTIGLLLVLFSPWPMTTSVSADVVTVGSVGDLFVSSANANSNYGGAGAMQVSSDSSSKGGMQSLIRFDAASVKTTFDTTYGAGNWRVESASIRFVTASPNNPIFNATTNTHNVSLTWMENDTWSEGTGSPMSPTNNGVTWNTLSSYASANDFLAASGSFTGTNANTAEVYNLTLGSNLVADLLAGGLVSFRLSAADNASSILYNTRSFGTAANRPQFSITAVAVPEPSTAIAVTGAACMFVARKLRSKKRNQKDF